MCRSSRQEAFCKKGVLRNFAKFTVAGCNFIHKETLAQVFSCEFCKISKNNFFTSFSGRLLLYKFVEKQLTWMLESTSRRFVFILTFLVTVLFLRISIILFLLIKTKVNALSVGRYKWFAIWYLLLQYGGITIWI